MPSAKDPIPYALPLNNCNANNSDSAPVDDDYMIFSSSAYDGLYNLMVGDIRTGQIWRMDTTVINPKNGRQKLGANYSAAR
jgi:hypothetical protein